MCKTFITQPEKNSADHLTIVVSGMRPLQEETLFWPTPMRSNLRMKIKKKFQRALQYIGFEVKLKPYIQRSDGSAKGDWDVGITVDVLQIALSLDRVILLSGDGDFDLLVDSVQTNCKVPVEVYGVEALSANSLISVASAFHPIIESSLI